MTAPLRIGILGAARIADEGIIAPARTLGHQVVAVAARDRTRAKAFAAEHGIATVHDGYAGVIADPGARRRPGLGGPGCPRAPVSPESYSYLFDWKT